MGTAELHQQEIAVGRLLHVRITRSEYNIDVLNFYQHAYQQDSSGAKSHGLWDRFNTTIQGVAKRNLLVVLGDFNCTPVHVPDHTGYELPRAKLYSDAAELATVLEANQGICLFWILPALYRAQEVFLLRPMKSLTTPGSPKP